MESRPHEGYELQRVGCNAEARLCHGDNMYTGYAHMRLCPCAKDTPVPDAPAPQPTAKRTADATAAKDSPPKRIATEVSLDSLREIFIEAAYAAEYAGKTADDLADRSRRYPWRAHLAPTLAFLH